MTPTQRTIQLLKKDGHLSAVVEKWIQFGPKDPRRKMSPGIRKDLFDIIDILVISDTETWGIQCCAGSGFSSHLQKLTVEKQEMTNKWLACPNRRLFIYAWRKLKKKRGGKAMFWKPRIEEIRN